MQSCPYCLSDRTRLSRFRRGDYAQLLLLRLPYRCRDCGSRFRGSLVGNRATLTDLKLSRPDTEEAADAPADAPAAPSPVQQERRQSPRYPCSLETFCYPSGKGGTQYLSWILNVSTGGLKLYAERIFRPGDQVTVRFRTEGRTGPRKFHVQVVHVYAADEEDTKGNTTLGCKFRSALSEKDLQTILRM